MEDFYSENAERYVENYGLDGYDEHWLIEFDPPRYIAGVKQYFDELNAAIGGRVRNAFDIGVGPAAREVLRYLKYGWDAYGCDISETVVARAQEKLQGASHEPTRVMVGDIRGRDELLDRKYDLISCLNVIQHFSTKQEVAKLASLYSNKAKDKCTGVLFFKRLDFNGEDALKQGLQFKQLGIDEYEYYDETFKQWRKYRTFDTKEILDVFQQNNFHLMAEFPSVLRFYNARKMPCTILTLEYLEKS